MFFCGAAGNKVVVEISNNKWQVAKQLIHKALKRLCCIGQTKQHKQIYEQSEGHDCSGKPWVGLNAANKWLELGSSNALKVCE